MKNFFIRLLLKYFAKNITKNTKFILQGDCFICIKGTNFDGHCLTQQAHQLGAKFILATTEDGYGIAKKNCPEAKVFLYKIKSHADMVKLLNCKYKNKPKLIAITGTNGKTSAVHFCIELLKQFNIKAASIGTLGVRTNFNCNLSFANTGLTTPDIANLYYTLNALYKQKVKYCFVEATSIALQTGRLSGLQFVCAGFTNFTQDHLDFHKTMDAYFASKMLLFSNYLHPNATAVINADIPQKNQIEKHIPHYVKKQYFELSNFQVCEDGEAVVFNNKICIDGKYPQFQLYNIALAIRLVEGLGFVFQKTTLPHLPMPEGRMQSVKNNLGVEIYIDFAHTPDAIEKILQSATHLLKPQAKLICVFGCGGDRDASKRPLMAQTVAKYATYAVITSDNPRTEDPQNIIDQITQGFNQCNFANFTQIIRREEAVEAAIKLAKKDDIIVIAGKGAETYQIIGTNQHPYNDEQQIIKILQSL